MAVTKTTLETREISELAKRACQHNDKNAFDQLVAYYWNRIFRMARKKLENDEEANDATAEVFARIYKYRKRMTKPKTFQPWLYKTAFNHFKKFGKARSQKNKHEGPFPDDPEQWIDLVSKDYESDPERALLVKEECRIVNDTIAGIRNYRHRMCAVLRFEDGKTIEEIADEMDMPKGTVKTCLSRIREKIRAKTGA